MSKEEDPKCQAKELEPARNGGKRMMRGSLRALPEWKELGTLKFYGLQ